MSGRTTERGYGNDHQKERRRWERLLKLGQMVVQCRCFGVCERHAGQCSVVISDQTPSGEWDLGHNPGQHGYAGPQCVPCNRAAGALSMHRGRVLVIRPL